MDAKKTIALARRHVSNDSAMESSARLCLADAVALFDKGELDAAKARAIDSLKYSVGICHQAYRRATGTMPR